MAAENTRTSTPIVLDSEGLERARQLHRAGNATIMTALLALEKDAEEASNCNPITIADKETTPPSGDKRDYSSMGPYWWPDPDTSDGLPYVRRDGEVNPETKNGDGTKLSTLCNTVHTLALAWYFLEEKRFAEHAVKLLQTFFLKENTRMNPNLNFGQAIPGRCEGRGIGIIDTVPFARKLIDAIQLLRSSPALTRDILTGLTDWFDTYLQWLRESSLGQDENNMANNHGTAYDFQVAVFAAFTGRETVTGQMLEEVPQKRISLQIEPDGRQPNELKRTKALGYSTVNLSLLFYLAEVGTKFDIDLWHFETEDGRSIRRALDWLLPFWTHQEAWEYQQIDAYPYERFCDLLRQAAWAYQDPAYANAISQIPLDEQTVQQQRSNLLYPCCTDQ